MAIDSTFVDQVRRFEKAREALAERDKELDQAKKQVEQKAEARRLARIEFDSAESAVRVACRVVAGVETT